MTATTAGIIRQIKGMTREEDLSALGRIRDAVEAIEHKAYLDSKRKIKARKDAVMKEVYDLMWRIHGNVAAHRDVPGHLVNEACRLLYRSATDEFCRADSLPATNWFGRINDMDVACIEAFRLIRKYVNCQKAKEFFLGKTKWARTRRGYRKNPETRIWNWFATAFTNGVCLYLRRTHNME